MLHAIAGMAGYNNRRWASARLRDKRSRRRAIVGDTDLACQAASVNSSAHRQVLLPVLVVDRQLLQRHRPIRILRLRHANCTTPGGGGTVSPRTANSDQNSPTGFS